MGCDVKGPGGQRRRGVTSRAGRSERLRAGKGGGYREADEIDKHIAQCDEKPQEMLTCHDWGGEVFV